MQKREILNIYFQAENNYYLLCRVINIGNEIKPDLKFSGFGDSILPNFPEDDKSIEGMRERFFKTPPIKNLELTYHNDGSFLRKIPDHSDKSKRYFNPHGVGERWTSINDITDFQPILNISIESVTIYRPEPLGAQTNKSSNYICINDELFNKEGQYLVIIYAKRKTFPISRYTTEDVYSDILCELNDEIQLCIILQRHYYPTLISYSSILKRNTRPYATNHFDFCKQEGSKDEMLDKMNINIFNNIFSDYLKMMEGDTLVRITKEKSQLIDQIDEFYKKVTKPAPIRKPIFIKLVLEKLPYKLSIFNNLRDYEKQLILKTIFIQNSGQSIKKPHNTEVR